MTTALQRTRQDGRDGDTGALPPATSLRTGRPRGSWFRRDPAWPIVALLAGWPIWWALGIGEFAPVVVSVPMAWRLYKWKASGRRPVRLPPGWWMWLLFLVVMCFGAFALGQTSPHTMPGSSSTRAISWGIRGVQYLGATFCLLYAGNLTEQELPRRRLAWLLGLIGIYAVAGGVGALGDPSLHFTSPLAAVLPQSLQNASGGQLTAMLHPAMTQLESFQGRGRVTAPFLYANTWGSDIALTLPWLFVAWRSYGTPWQRKAIWVVGALSVVPIVFSFDRGLWLAIACGLFYLAVRFALAGKTAMLGAFLGVLLLVTVVILLTPLQALIVTRLQNGSSDSSRLTLSILSTEGALSSPIIGYGDTRREFGSNKSIAIGKTSNCSACGNRSAGSNGQLWLLLITTGFVGTFLYMGFFVYGSWRYWGDLTPYGITGVMIILFGFVFSVAYSSVGSPLSFIMLGYALLWKNDRESRLASRLPATADGRADLADGGPRGMTAGAPA